MNTKIDLTDALVSLLIKVIKPQLSIKKKSLLIRLNQSSMLETKYNSQKVVALL